MDQKNRTPEARTPGKQTQTPKPKPKPKPKPEAEEKKRSTVLHFTP